MRGTSRPDCVTLAAVLSRAQQAPAKPLKPSTFRHHLNTSSAAHLTRDFTNAQDKISETYRGNHAARTMAPIHTLNDLPSQVPSQVRSVKDRYCPGMRSCWDLDLRPFDPRGRDTEDYRRRICMCIVLGSIVFFDFVSLTSALFKVHIAGFIIGLLIDIIGLFFIMGCLIRIGDAEGERTVVGKRIVSLASFTTC